MNCSNCNKLNNSENNFCSYCGQQLKYESGDVTAAPQHTIFSGNYTAQKNSNADLGFMIIALLILANIIVWIGWSFFARNITDSNRALYFMIRFISIGLAIAEFIVMVVFAKNAAYRIVIGIIGLIVTFYNLYFLIKTFNELRGL